MNNQLNLINVFFITLKLLFFLLLLIKPIVYWLETSHILLVESALALTILLPSGLNETYIIGP